MNISLEELVSLVSKEVVKELHKLGFKIELPESTEILHRDEDVSKNRKRIMNFDGFVTPLVTEDKIIELDEGITEIIVPAKTIFTPSALDLIKKRKIDINKSNK